MKFSTKLNIKLSKVFREQLKCKNCDRTRCCGAEIYNHDLYCGKKIDAYEGKNKQQTI